MLSQKITLVPSTHKGEGNECKLSGRFQFDLCNRLMWRESKCAGYCGRRSENRWLVVSTSVNSTQACVTSFFFSEFYRIILVERSFRLEVSKPWLTSWWLYILTSTWVLHPLTVVKKRRDSAMRINNLKIWKWKCRHTATKYEHFQLI